MVLVFLSVWLLSAAGAKGQPRCPVHLWSLDKSSEDTGISENDIELRASSGDEFMSYGMGDGDGSSFASFSGGAGGVYLRSAEKLLPGTNGGFQDAPENALTVMAWARAQQDRAGDVQYAGIVSYAQDNGAFERGFFLGAVDGRWCFAVANAGGKLLYLTGGDAIKASTWYHVAGTYDGSHVRLYVDGAKVASAAHPSGPISYASAYFAIGAYKDDNEEYKFSGDLYTVAIYSAVLSDGEVSDASGRHGSGCDAVDQADGGEGGTDAGVNNMGGRTFEQGTLVDSALVPICTEEPFCLIRESGAAECLDVSGDFMIVHPGLAQISVDGTTLAAVDDSGATWIYTRQGGTLPCASEQWARLNETKKTVMAQVTVTKLDIFGVDIDGRLLHRTLAMKPEADWAAVSTPDDLKSRKIIGVDSSSCADAVCVYVTDSTSCAWRLVAEDGAGSGEWADISADMANRLSAVTAQGDIVFGVSRSAGSSGSDVTAWFRDLSVDATCGDWVEVDPRPGKRPLTGRIVMSRCGGVSVSPDAKSFYVFATDSRGVLYYRFVYALHPSAGSWLPLPQAEGKVWRPAGEAADHDMLDGRAHALAKNYKVATLDTTYRHFRVQFDLTVTRNAGGWASIVHFTTGSNNRRIPALWLAPGTTKLVASMDQKHLPNVVCDTHTSLTPNQRAEISLEIADGYYRVFIDGNEKCAQIWPETLAFPATPNVHVYASDPWHSAAAGRIARLQYREREGPVPINTKDITGGKLMEIRKNQYLGTIKVFSYYHMHFELTIRSRVASWGSVIHFTTGGNHGTPGERIPGIWLSPGDTRLTVASETAAAMNPHCYSRTHMSLNRKYAIDIYHAPGCALVVEIDRKFECVVQISPRGSPFPPTEGIRVYAGDPWHPPASARLEAWSYSELQPLSLGEDMLGSEEYELSPRFLGSIDTAENWKLAFDLKPTGTRPQWASIFQIWKHGEGGQFARQPGIWFIPGTTRLHVRAGTVAHHNAGCDTAALAVNTVSKVEVFSVGTLLTVEIDGKKACETNRPGPPVPGQRGMVAWASVPFHYDAARAVISALSYDKLPEPPSYVLKFKVGYWGSSFGAAPTGPRIKVRGESAYNFHFHPGFPGGAARVDSKFGNQNIGYTPGPNMWHDMTVTVRESGWHTWRIETQGGFSWEKDVKIANYFSKDDKPVVSLSVDAGRVVSPGSRTRKFKHGWHKLQYVGLEEN